MTLKPGEKQAVARHQRVRQAVNHAINRHDIITAVYSGEGEYSGHVPPGYGPWPLTDAELKQKYLKFDLPAAKKLMADAGFAKGFSVTMTTFATPGLPAGLGGRPVAAEGDQHRRQHRRPGGRHLRRQQRRRQVRLGSHRPRHARRRRRLRGRVPSGRTGLQDLVPRVQEREGVARHRQRPDPARSRQAPADLQGWRRGSSCSTRCRSRSSRSRSTRSCASACRACTSRSATSTRGSAPCG